MKTEFIIRCIYALCLIGAGFNHLQTVLMHGLFWDYNNAPLFTCIYWTSLTFIDPLAAILLFYRPRIGLILTFLIIFSDVIHNTWITLKVGRDLLNYMYISQFLFLVFVLCTIKFPWKEHKKS
ncbi:hypothetical protein RMB03_10735 [Acinetobacter sp. V91_7]|uniref:hypothetical protein n=1 Tax=unclassified Acinetobacter TaxID=196816 RepID=UPI00287E6DB9|nr:MULTISPECIES: hypothetical protein [unclassified Acinetobacter]MDS7933207.1 hypothetical protein [Acinetobacter sp. V91_4B]MDS7963432.1 hypothetical protein [Acinetobacter sp. V91_7]MDS8027461.1 hypothetical protein [Acinetobacter sp. V91_13]